MDELERRAKTWARHWHAGQVRKYTGEPYYLHPGSVAHIVKGVPHTPEMIAAAWMHDTLEDTDATQEEMRREFGDEVTSLVVWLTDVASEGNREARKTADRIRLAQAPVAAKTVKIADLIDNSKSIVKYDPDFAVTYLREKRLLLDEALREGDATLWKIADAIVRRADERKLEDWFRERGRAG